MTTMKSFYNSTIKSTNLSQTFYRTTISKQGNFIKPITHQNYTSENMHVICQGYGPQGKQTSKFIHNILTSSLGYLLNQIENQTSEIKYVEEQLLLNLVQSGFQELYTQKLNGSCSFVACCIWKHSSNKLNTQLTVIKNSELQCYIVGENQVRCIRSRKMPFKLKKELNYQGFFSTDKKFNKQMYNTELFIQTVDINNTKDEFIILGSSFIFNYFNEYQLIRYLQEGKNKNLVLVGEQIMNQAKKRWRTIYQSDMSLIITRI